MWQWFDAVMERAAMYFGLSVTGMHEATALACYALGIAAFVGMVLGDGWAWPPTVLTFALLITGSTVLDRVQRSKVSRR